MEAVTCGRQQCQARVLLSCGPLASPRELRPTAGLGQGVLAIFGRQATGPLGWFSASRNNRSFAEAQGVSTKCSPPRARRRERPGWLFGGFLSLDPGEAVEGQGKTKVGVSSSSVGLFSKGEVIM